MKLKLHGTTKKQSFKNVCDEFPIETSTLQNFARFAHKKSRSYESDSDTNTPILLFIIYLYINKVCDVCDESQGPSYRGLDTHRLNTFYVRNTCICAKSLIRLQEVQGLNKNAPSLMGLLQCK